MDCVFLQETKVTIEDELNIFENVLIDKFIRVKNKENSNRYNEKELKKIIFNAIDLDFYQANRYIQTKFDSPYTIEGSTSFEIL